MKIDALRGRVRILFVCHGNICRSPMAEYIFKHLAEERGLTERFFAESRATSSEEIWNGVGNPVYPQARAELERHGIFCGRRQATRLEPRDYGAFDLILGMDQANLRNMRRILGDDPEEKLGLLMEFTERGGEVADPWYSNRFDVAYRDIFDGCEGLLRALTAEDGKERKTP
ncbi:MAG: low molecular weight phosphotyrosine protein phosphatase [Ruminococcaceae bacterium]|nr:low molecular weight phosphotyrosine protein phosphatase [Oscillospiraceae bacterium]